MEEGIKEMKEETELQRKIRTYLEVTGLTITALERKGGLKMNVARNILKGSSKRPTAETLQGVATAMGCTVQDLLGVSHDVIKAVLTPPDKSAPVEHPEIMTEILQTVFKVVADNNYTLTLDKLLLILGEVYTYSIKKPSLKIDIDFVEWFVKRTLTEP